MCADCTIEKVSDLHSLYDSLHHDHSTFIKVAFGIFITDGCLCVIFAFLTHLKYTSVTVLHYSVSANAISNTRWVWFFIFNAISLFLNGINIWLSLRENKKTKAAFIIGWISHLLAVLVLAFAIKKQWKYREEAFDHLSQSHNESTPFLPHITGHKFPSSGDVCLTILALISCAFFIPAVTGDSGTWFWLAFGFSWFLRLIIIVMVFVIHYKLSLDGPSILIKCTLLAGVLLNTASDIPSYMWIECFFKRGGDHLLGYYYGVLSVMVLSHILFFAFLRAEFLRLKDITRWHIADHIDHLDVSPLQRHGYVIDDNK